jgi:hypothetical protein
MNGSTGRWVGIDVAKSKLDVALLDERGKVKSHVFSNDAKGHAALIAWLQQRGGPPKLVRVCMDVKGRRILPSRGRSNFPTRLRCVVVV